MTLIQVALAAGVILIGVYMYLRLRSTLFDVFLIGLISHSRNVAGFIS